MTIQTPAWTLGDRLAKSRHGAGLSQQQIADHLLVSRQTVINWEKGHRPPTRRKIEAWARVTNVDPDWLAGISNGVTDGYAREVGTFLALIAA